MCSINRFKGDMSCKTMQKYDFSCYFEMKRFNQECRCRCLQWKPPYGVQPD